MTVIIYRSVNIEPMSFVYLLLPYFIYKTIELMKTIVCLFEIFIICNTLAFLKVSVKHFLFLMAHVVFFIRLEVTSFMMWRSYFTRFPHLKFSVNRIGRCMYTSSVPSISFNFESFLNGFSFRLCLFALFRYSVTLIYFFTAELSFFF